MMKLLIIVTCAVFLFTDAVESQWFNFGPGFPFDNGNFANEMNNFQNNLNRELQTLGQNIQNTVSKSLEPVNALKIKSDMAQGIGGVTVATYGDSTKMIIKNGIKYKCSGNIFINKNTGLPDCASLTRISPESEDICTRNNYSQVNNQFCFGNIASISCINSRCECNGGEMYTLNRLKQKCGPTYGDNNYVKYDYYPDRQDINAIEIPNPNKSVRCENDSNDHCVWHTNAFVINF